MKIVKLELDENSLIGGIDAVALVEQPAIEEDFLMFAKEEFETYNDYPKAARENARVGIERNKENDNKCATQVGKVRAQQLANGEKVSLDTIRRMRSFLIRQKDNYDLAVSRKDYDACGYISYMLWGGPEALPWAEKKLRQAGEEFVEEEFIDPNPCQTGYIAYGTKIKGGREVPNCVPIQASAVKNIIIEELIKQEMAQIGEIDNVPVYDSIDEAKAAAEKMGCTGYHEHKIGEDVIGYMPCESHDKIISALPQEKQDAILQTLENVGITEDDMANQGYVEVEKDKYNEAIAEAFRITSEPNKGSVADRGEFKVLYKYDGPKDSRNRDFCADMLRANLLFRKEDINNLSVSVENQEFGFYDIFKWRGSYNCRHTWVAKLFTKTNLDPKKALTDLPGLGSSESTKPLDPNTGKTTGMNTDTGAQTFAREELDEKQMLVGPLMVPDKLIKRIDENGEEYFVYFDENTVEQLAYKTMEDKIGDKVNIEHNQKEELKDVYLAESWIIKDPKNDKSRLYGFNLPKGTWMGIYKINNKEVWNQYVKTGKVKGFSVEGYFAQKLEKYAVTK